MKLFHGKLALAGFLVILLFIAFLLPARKASYAQNSGASSSAKEIIVVFKNRPTVSLLSALSANTTQNLEIKNGIAASNAMVFDVTSGDVKTAMTELSRDPNVAAVFPNYQLSLQALPNDPQVVAAPVSGLPRQQWNLFNLKLAGTERTAWDVTTGAANVVVAVIDSGVNSTHLEFSGKISSLVDCSTGSCTEVNSMTDNYPAGHGTHVAGLVGAATNNNVGIASAGYNTKLMILRVMASDGNTATDDFFNAIKWAVDHGAKIITTSFGAVADSLVPAAITEYNNTIAYAWERGVVVVAAAGNCGGNSNGVRGCEIHLNGDPNVVTGYAQNSKLYPAASPNVISVAATTWNDTLASYSEHNDSGNSKIGNWISVAAPGGDGACTDATKTCILSTVPTNQYFWQSGTSMASPQVAAVAALVWAAKPSLTNEQVKNIIETTANHSIPAGTNNGLVNALAAVEAAAGNSSNTTPTPSPTGNISPSLTPTTAATSSATPTPGGPTATPTVTPYPTVPPRLPKTPPNPYPEAPFCPLTSTGVGDTSVNNLTVVQNIFNSLSKLFVSPVYAGCRQVCGNETYCEGCWDMANCTNKVEYNCRDVMTRQCHDRGGGNWECGDELTRVCDEKCGDGGHWKQCCGTYATRYSCHQECTPDPTSPPPPTATRVPTAPPPTATPRPTATPAPSVTVTPTVTPIPASPTPTVTPGGPTLTPTIPPVVPQGTCAKKPMGDANCDGNVDALDFTLWLEQYDTLVYSMPPNQSANYACVEGNKETYFVDLVSFEIWRRNTTSGLIILPSPSPTITSIPPTNTPAPQSGGGGGGGGSNTGGGGGNTSGGGGGGGGCGGDNECPSGYSCVKGGGGNVCRPNTSAETKNRNDADKTDIGAGDCNGPQDCPYCGFPPNQTRSCNANKKCEC